jgi:transcription elongation factor Elf1
MKIERFKIKRIYVILDNVKQKLIYTTDNVLQCFGTKKSAKEFKQLLLRNYKDIAPCPFCNSDDVELHRNFDYVYCKNCGARGSFFDGHPQDAINAWNNKTTNKLKEIK